MPLVDELVGADVEEDVALGPLPKHLFVNASSVSAIVEVVNDRLTAPADVQRELDRSRRLRDVRSGEIDGNGDRPARGSKSAGPSRRHGQEV